MGRRHGTSGSTTVLSLALLGLAGATALAGAGAPTAAAATQQRYVSTTGSNSTNNCLAKSKPCRTVQHAVNVASSGDTVSVAKGTYRGSVAVGKSMRIEGATDGVTTLIGSGAPGVQVSPGDGVTGVVTVSLSHVSISFNDDGVGVNAIGANLDLSHVRTTEDTGGGVLTLGGHTTITDSQIDTIAPGFDDGLGFPGDGSGVQIFGGSLTMTRTRVDNNSGAGVEIDQQDSAASAEDPQAVIASSATISDSDIVNGIIGGIANFGGSVEVTNTTLQDNEAAGIASLGGSVVVRNSTLTNTATEFGYVGGEQGALLVLKPVPTSGSSLRAAVGSAGQKAHQRMVAEHRPALARAAARLPAADPAAADAVGKVTVSGSIIAYQQDKLPDCYGPVISAGYNVSSDPKNSCKFGKSKHDLAKTDPKLGSLGSHGGPTQTRLPRKGSVAIDAIPSGAANCSTSATDQRGQSRPQPVGGRCDIGAVELAAKKLAITTTKLPSGTVGKRYSTKLRATGGQFPSYAWKQIAGKLPPGITLTKAGTLHGTPTRAGTYHLRVSVNDPVERSYTLVVHAAAKAPDGDHATTPSNPQPVPQPASAQIADTGAPTNVLTALGTAGVLAGLLALCAARRAAAKRRRVHPLD